MCFRSDLDHQGRDGCHQLVEAQVEAGWRRRAHQHHPAGRRLWWVEEYQQPLSPALPATNPYHLETHRRLPPNLWLESQWSLEFQLRPLQKREIQHKNSPRRRPHRNNHQWLLLKRNLRGRSRLSDKGLYFVRLVFGLLLSTTWENLIVRPVRQGCKEFL